MNLSAHQDEPRQPHLYCRSIARTHIGKVRMVNEDRLLDHPDHRLWAVADGMGGHSRGDRAATLVIHALAELAEGGAAIDRYAIDGAIQDANRAILALSEERERCGSTVAGLHAAGGTATLFWAGDSRIYRFRDGGLERLTCDHSYVQQLIDAGLITPAQARSHPQANLITRAVGIDARLELEYASVPIMPGDHFLLCSDGLSSLVEDQEVAKTLSADPETAPGRLIDQALEAGGSDNISLILISVLPA